MQQLGREAREAVDQYRERKTPNAEVAQRAWDRIAERIAAGEQGLDAGRRRPPLGRYTMILSVVAAAAAAAVLLGRPEEVAEQGDGRFIKGAYRAEVENRGTAGQATPRMPTSPRASQPEPSDEAGPEAPSAGSPPAEPGPTSAPRAVPRTRRAPAAETPVPEASVPKDAAQRVMAEAALIGKARAALRDGKPRAALGLLDEHARTYESGALEEERLVLRISALCEAGHIHESRELGRKFLADRPKSPLSTHVRRLCAGSRD